MAFIGEALDVANDGCGILGEDFLILEKDETALLELKIEKKITSKQG